MLLLLALLSVYAIAADDFNCNYGHMNKLWTPEERKAILEVHNVMRTKIREGKYVAGDGKLVPFHKKPAAKKGTLPNLIYNCTIEESAQRWANKCPGLVHSPDEERPGYGENIAFSYVSYDEKPENFIGHGKKAGDSWEEEFIKKGWSSGLMTPALLYTAGHATQMAWAKTTHIGCGINYCSQTINFPHEVIVVCQYFPPGNYPQAHVYEEDPDWTDSSPSQPTLPVNAMSDDLDCKFEGVNWPPKERRDILEVHNVMRRKIREGKYVAGDGKLVPFHRKPAAKKGTMPDLKYNCTMEMQAQRWADKCQYLKHSPGAERPCGENLICGENAAYGGVAVLPNGTMNYTGHGQNAGNMWENEVIHKGWPSNQLTPEFDIGLLHASQMAWAKTTQIGCGIRACPGPYMIVICHYFPHGNGVSEYIYEEDPDWTGSSPSQLPLLCALAFLTWYWLCPQHL